MGKKISVLLGVILIILSGCDSKNSLAKNEKMHQNLFQSKNISKMSLEVKLKME